MQPKTWGHDASSLPARTSWSGLSYRLGLVFVGSVAQEVFFVWPILCAFAGWRGLKRRCRVGGPQSAVLHSGFGGGADRRAGPRPSRVTRPLSARPRTSLVI